MGLALWLASRIPLREGGLREALLAPALKSMRSYAADWSAYGRQADPDRAPIAILREEKARRDQ